MRNVLLRLRGETQSAQLGKGFGENGKRPRGALGIGRVPRLGAQARAHGLDGGELFQHRGFEPLDGGVVEGRGRGGVFVRCWRRGLRMLPLPA